MCNSYYKCKSHTFQSYIEGLLMKSLTEINVEDFTAQFETFVRKVIKG